jgi:hypothetical protein
MGATTVGATTAPLRFPDASYENQPERFLAIIDFCTYNRIDFMEIM